MSTGRLTRQPSTSVSKRMRAVRTAGTAPELRVREIANRIGLRYRINVGSLLGKPDLANKTRKWVVFVHGCFWHGHACKKGRHPKINLDFWKGKIEANRRRDRERARQLAARGFSVVTVWQCELDDERRVVGRLSELMPRRKKSVVRRRGDR
jgi:DNA mismatch endonuclease (patch repair protein)